MDQKLLNRNLINALSKMNKALMSLQEKVIVLSSQSASTIHIADLTRMDMSILDELQGNLDRIRNSVQS